VAAGLLAATTLLITIGATARTLGAPMIWAIDVALLCFAWCAMLGADLALRRNTHIEIDVFVRYLAPGTRRALAYLWLVVIAGLLLILIVYGMQLTFLNVERPLGDTELSYAMVTASIPGGAALMLWTVLRRLVRAATGRERLSLEGRDGRVL
jgi:TRAP-type transport system small permease protein